MTINGAKLLGIDNERGMIKEGFYADIVAADENPLDNIQTLKKISFVMKEGLVVKQTEQ
jgi:imidazolonepropionase-like amidohydrolase